MVVKEYAAKLNEDREPFLYMVRKMDYSEKLTKPEEVVKAVNCLFDLENKAEEYVYMLCLDAKGGIKGVLEIGHGGMDACFADARIVFSRALLLGANSIIVVHNHITGDPTMSSADLEIAAKLKAGGEMLDIWLNDFIVVGRNCYTSLREDGMLPTLQWKGKV